ncbi:MAG: sigma-54-dependent transcriptional regulator [Candidatus Scalindua sp.]
MENKIYSILLIDDDRAAYTIINNGLANDRFEVLYESDPENALSSAANHKPDAILLDIMFNGENKGKSILEKLKESKLKTIPVIMLTSTMRDYKEADYPEAAFAFAKEVFRGGDAAFTNLSELIENAVKQSDNIEPDDSRFGFVVGDTSAMHDVCKTILEVAPTDATVLVIGETGTGKEGVANAIHKLSNRNNAPFVKVNCGAFSEENLLISELFGHEKGSFTGANETRKGIFETASGGTVFLDEIGDTTPQAQVKLLRVIQQKEITRLGSSTPIQIDIRIVAATNKNIKEEIQAGKFREDLYYRLNVVKISLPPLRRRADDIERFFSYFVNIFNIKHKKFISDIVNTELLGTFRDYNWTGNIREFENKIERAIIGKKGNVLLPSDFRFSQEDTSPIDVNSIADKFLKKEYDGTYFINELKGELRRLVIIDVYNKLYKKNGTPPTSKELADVFSFRPDNMRRKIDESNLTMEELKKQYPK